jgi:hypothetical protein
MARRNAKGSLSAILCGLTWRTLRLALPFQLPKLANAIDQQVDLSLAQLFAKRRHGGGAPR